MGKARTRAQKLKLKRGRPRLAATDRQPNGQPSRRIASIEQREHETRRPALLARARHLNITETQALDPRRGYTLGRLLLDGKITQRQHDAGVKIGEAMSRYYGLKGLRLPSARAQDLFAVRADPGEDSEERGQAARKAATRVMAVRKVLQNVGDINTGRKVQRACEGVCFEDIDAAQWGDAALLLLRRGLNKVADLFALPG